MGGYGSGRRWSTARTTDEFFRIDVRWLEREGYLSEGHSGWLTWSRHGEKIGSIQFRAESDRLVLSYRSRQHGEENWESLEYPVFLERTSCHYGGSRSWLLCPAKGCGRRVAILYGGRIYACRRCYRLAYPSQRENPSDRASERAWGILSRLRCDKIMDISEGEPLRPRGMHKRTYLRLCAQYERDRSLAFCGMAARLGLTDFFK
jgi:hypothetical protein